MATLRTITIPRAIRQLTTSSTRPFSTSRPSLDLAKVQLLGNLGATPQRFTLNSGNGEGVRYKVAVNRGKDKPASWFTVVSFDAGQIDRLAPNNDNAASGGGQGGGGEDLKGAKVLVDALIDIQPVKDDSGNTIGERVQLRQTGLQIISRPGAGQQGGGGSGSGGGSRGADDVHAQRLAGEDSFSG